MQNTYYIYYKNKHQSSEVANCTFIKHLHQPKWKSFLQLIQYIWRIFELTMLLHLKLERSFYINLSTFFLNRFWTDFNRLHLHSCKSRFVCSRWFFFVKKCVRTLLTRALTWLSNVKNPNFLYSWLSVLTAIFRNSWTCGVAPRPWITMCFKIFKLHELGLPFSLHSSDFCSTSF